MAKLPSVEYRPSFINDGYKQYKQTSQDPYGEEDDDNKDKEDEDEDEDKLTILKQDENNNEIVPKLVEPVDQGKDNDDEKTDIEIEATTETLRNEQESEKTLFENTNNNRDIYGSTSTLIQDNDDEIQQDDIIDIKTWICDKNKLIVSINELFTLGYNVDNIMRGKNKKGGVHNIHYICQSMYHVRDNEILLQFGIGIVQMMITRNNRLIDIKDEDENTTIYYCIDSEVYELVILFVENGADLYHTNIYKESPLEYALQKCESNEIKEYLTELNIIHHFQIHHTHHSMVEVILLPVVLMEHGHLVIHLVVSA